MVSRIAKDANHNLKIKDRVRARGSRGQNWYSETRSQFVKKKARTQSLWMLHIAGDFHESLERERPKPKPVLMTGSMGAKRRSIPQRSWLLSQPLYMLPEDTKC